MKLKIYLASVFLFCCAFAFGQTISYSDGYQITAVTLTKEAALVNGRPAYTGSGLAKDGKTYTYRVLWCSSYQPQNNANSPFGAWIIGSPNDGFHSDNCTANAYWINRNDVMAPPPMGTTLHWTSIVSGGGTLTLNGTGCYGPPTVSTTTATAITINTATIGGNVTIDGGENVTDRGIVTSTSANPTIADTKTAIGTGTGTFSQLISGFSPSTTYHYRAYATNKNGTSYGADNSFTTPTPTINLGGTITSSNTTYGTPSANGSFTVSGVNMAAGILVTPPSGFEVSTNASSGFASAVTVGAAGTISTTTVYIRLAATTAQGSYSGNVTLSSASASSQTISAGSATIAKYALTITAAAKSKNYGDSDPPLTYIATTGSLQNSDAFTGSLTRTAGENIGAYAINQGSVALSSNYTLSFVSANLTINKRAVAITASAATKTYGRSDPTLSYNITTGSLVSGDAFSGALSRAAGENIGTYAINQGTVALSSNYTLTYNGANLTINKKAIAITANAQSKNYGDTDPSLTYAITTGGSLVSGDAFTGTLSRTAGENIGTYAIAQGSLALNNNYTLTYNGANLTISKKAIAVTANAQSKTYGGTDPTLTYTNTALVSGDAFTGTLTRVAGETADTTYAIGIGTLALSNNYTLNFTGASLTINKASLTITAANQSKLYGDANPALTFAYSGFVNGEGAANLTTAPTISTTADVNSAIGSYPITVSGAAATNYSFNYVNGALTINPHTNNDLANLAISVGTLSPTFSTGTLSYTASVNSSVRSIIITPTVSDATATVTVNGAAVTSGSASGAISLSPGSNVINVVVTAQNTSLTKTYTLTVNRAIPDLNLSYLTLSEADISPVFSNAVTSYTSSVTGYPGVTLNFALEDATSSIKVNGTDIPAGQNYAFVSLNLGSNPINVLVTASDQSFTRTYTINANYALSNVATLDVLRSSVGGYDQPFDQPFDPSLTTYTKTVIYQQQTANFTPYTGHYGTTIKVNGTSVANGNQSNNYALAIGDNVLNTVVTAQDGVSQKTYTVTVTRSKSDNDFLNDLTITGYAFDTPFDYNVRNFTAHVPNAASSIMLTPVTENNVSTVTINGAALASGSASAGIPLSVGNNTIITTVTAQDGVTAQSYTLIVTRAGSADDKLANLTINTGTLTPVFDSATLSYSETVASSVASVTLTPTANDATASITVNGSAVNSGTESAAFFLQPGDNAIPVNVTAQDGVTAQTYTVTVTRTPADVALASLTINKGTLSPAFDPTKHDYSVSVAYTTTSLTITPLADDPTATVKVGGGAALAVGASKTVSLHQGVNNIAVTVRANDGSNQGVYFITVNRTEPSNVNTLSGLALSTGTLSPSFDGATTLYTASTTASSITLTPTGADTTETVTVNSSPVAQGAASGAIALNFGDNTITTIVTAQSGTTTTYTLTVTRVRSADATLANLAISSGVLSPLFDAGTNSYTASVDNGVSSITVTPGVNNANATVTVNGATVTSGSPSADILLNIGNNTVTTVVTAEDGTTTNTYALVVTRVPRTDATANLSISSGALTQTSPNLYSVSVDHDVSSVTLTATPNDPAATVTANFGGVDVSLRALTNIPLTVNTPVIVNISVVAQDGITSNTYSIAITRKGASDASLANLSINNGTLSPSFATGIKSYSVTVDNSVSSVKVTPTLTDPNATVKVDDVLVSSGTASADIPLQPGVNSIDFFVQAEDLFTFAQYSVKVTRTPSANASLAGISVSAGNLSPVFSGSTTSYTDTVSHATAFVTVTPTTADTSANIKIRGNVVTSGTASGSILVGVGTSPIQVGVTAQDGTQKTYTVTVVRVSSDAGLSGLALSSGTFSQAFAIARFSYSASVSNSTTSIMVSPTAQNAAASIKVNGVAVATGTASAGIALNVGTNTITTVVTSQDRSTTFTYTITVTRASSSNADLANLNLGSGTLTPVFSKGTTSYTDTVSHATTSVTVIPTTADPNASIKVKGIAVISGTASGSIPLYVGTNPIQVLVTAQDGTQKTYTVTVIRVSSDAGLSGLALSSGTFSQAFAIARFGYSASVNNSTSSVTVTPTAENAAAAIKVNGIAVATGKASAGIALNVGTNTITTVVTSQDRSTTFTYTITVTRASSSNADLASLNMGSGTLTPVFSNGTTSYTDTVSHATTSVTIIPTIADPNASIKVKGIAVISGTASGSIPLYVGANPIQVLVTAQDGSQKTYTVTVIRVSSDAGLTNLALTSGTLSPFFSITKFGYSASVSNSTTSVTITPTAENAAAIIKVNGTTVPTGTASAGIPLNVGANTITTVVTSQDKSTTSNYTITITRSTQTLNSIFTPVGNGSSTPLIASLRNEQVIANNILSPNGDGVNDIWVVKNIAFYPNNTVTVFDRTGNVVFTKKNYANDWAGSYRGSVLTEGTYFYLIDLGNGEMKKGFITVVKDR